MIHETPETIALSIGALSERTACHIETIRYYERIALLPEPPRTQSGRRVYDETHVQRLLFIRRARDLGFPLEQIRSMIALSEKPDASCAAVTAMTAAHLASVRAKLEDLRRLEAALDAMVRRCQRTTIGDCTILATLADMPA